MKITYRNKFLDIVVFNLYHLSRLPIMIVVLVGTIILISLLIWQSTIRGLPEYSFIVRLVTFLILDLFCIGGFLVGVLLIIILSNISRMNKTVLAETTINLTPDFILDETPFSRSEIKWASVQKLVRTRSHMYIYLMQHSAIVIPRRAFDNSTSWDEFWHTCQEKTKAG